VRPSHGQTRRTPASSPALIARGVPWRRTRCGCRGSLRLQRSRCDSFCCSTRFDSVRRTTTSSDAFSISCVDYEALGQFGSFGSPNIRAWTVASETGYRSPTVLLKPRFSAKADIFSGDDPRTNTLGTFNPLFPKGNNFGVTATAGPGPINFIDVRPHAETALSHNLTVSVDWIVQWRESLRDGVYSVPGVSDYSRRKEQRASRRASSRHGGTLASESSPLVSGRLWNFLCWEIR
jgi:Alginate export